MQRGVTEQVGYRAVYLVETVDDLWNHIAYVMAYAPDRFPYRDFLPADGQMTLDRAFELLHQGVLVAYPEQEWSSKRDDLHALLDRSYASFRGGDERLATKLLYEFEDSIFRA